MYDILFIDSNDALSRHIINELEHSMLRIGILSFSKFSFLPSDTPLASSDTLLPTDNSTPFIPSSRLILSTVKNKSINEALILECISSKTIFIGTHETSYATKFHKKASENNVALILDCNLERILLRTVMGQILKFCKHPEIRYRTEKRGLVLTVMSKICEFIRRVSKDRLSISFWSYRMIIELKGKIDEKSATKRLNIESDMDIEQLTATVLTQFVYFVLEQAASEENRSNQPSRGEPDEREHAPRSGERGSVEGKKGCLFPEHVLGDYKFIEMLRGEKIKIELTVS